MEIFKDVHAESGLVSRARNTWPQTQLQKVKGITRTTCTRASSRGAVKSPKRWMPLRSPKALKSACNLISMCFIHFTSIKLCAHAFILNTSQHSSTMLQFRRNTLKTWLRAQQKGDLKKVSTMGMEHTVPRARAISSFVWWSSMWVSPLALTLTSKRPCDANCCKW